MATGNLPQHTPIGKSPQKVFRAAIYARVSTANNGQDPTVQTRELEEYCQRRSWEIAGCYVDIGVSGAKDSRPELNRLMANAHQRRFDAVLVWKLDRFGGSLRHLVNALAELEALGVAFVSLRDNLDLSTPSGRLMFQIIGAMAEFERSLIVERVKAGMRNARAKGKRIGRPASHILGPGRATSHRRGLSAGSRQPAATGRPIRYVGGHDSTLHYRWLTENLRNPALRLKFPGRERHGLFVAQHFGASKIDPNGAELMDGCGTGCRAGGTS
jgi:DNA invertase Pin-like site-specific DNA recombinase